MYEEAMRVSLFIHCKNQMVVEKQLIAEGIGGEMPDVDSSTINCLESVNLQ